jgi:hypothetical protein
MIRSLFLIGILVVLVAFAFKRPEQTALEFAREVADKAQTKMTKNTVEPARSRPLAPDLLIAKTPLSGGETWREKVGQTKIVVAKTENQKIVRKEPVEERLPEILPPAVAKTAALEKREPKAAVPMMERLLLPTGTSDTQSDAPPMPWAPLLEVASEPLGKVGNAKTISAVKPATKSLRLTDPDLIEVRANLENAARLLAEVK